MMVLGQRAGCRVAYTDFTLLTLRRPRQQLDASYYFACGCLSRLLPHPFRPMATLKRAVWLLAAASLLSIAAAAANQQARKLGAATSEAATPSANASRPVMHVEENLLQSGYEALEDAFQQLVGTCLYGKNCGGACDPAQDTYIGEPGLRSQPPLAVASCSWRGAQANGRELHKRQCCDKHVDPRPVSADSTIGPDMSC